MERRLSSPVFKDNVIYFGGDNGNVYAVDAATGHQIRKRATNGPVPATPAIADGTVYVGSYDGKFYALNAQTGALKWRFTTDGERRFEATGLHGMQPKDQMIADPFFFHSSWREAPIVATDEQIRLGGIYSSLLVINGVVYFGSADGFLCGLE